MQRRLELPPERGGLLARVPQPVLPRLVELAHAALALRRVLVGHGQPAHGGVRPPVAEALRLEHDAREDLAALPGLLPLEVADEALEVGGALEVDGEVLGAAADSADVVDEVEEDLWALA